MMYSVCLQADAFFNVLRHLLKDSTSAVTPVYPIYYKLRIHQWFPGGQDESERSQDDEWDTIKEIYCPATQI